MNGTETATPEPRRHDGMDQPDSPRGSERDLARTRADLNDTLRALEHRFSREQLIDQALDYVRGGPREFAVNLGEQARDNPLPVALTAIGIAWLMFAGRREERGPEYTSEGIAETGSDLSTRARERYGEAVERGHQQYENLTERGKEAYGSVAESAREMGEKLSDKGEQLRESMGEKMEQARAGMEHARRGLRYRARAMVSGMRRGSEGTASGIRQSGEKTRNTFSYLSREQPLALAALGVALGAALAAALPTTRRERETFGPARDETVNRLRETGREQMERSREDLKQAVSEPSPHSGPH